MTALARKRKRRAFVYVYGALDELHYRGLVEPSRTPIPSLTAARRAEYQRLRALGFTPFDAEVEYILEALGLTDACHATSVQKLIARMQ